MICNNKFDTRMALRPLYADSADSRCVAHVLIIHREWKPYGAESIGMQPKMESLMTGFMYPAENENDD